jgi:hypothetical protein
MKPNPQKSSASPSSINHALATSIRRHSKIARLPAELRERLNVMLNDGASYTSISASFRQLGHQLNSANLSRWHARGFQDWLREQTWLEDMRSRVDFASALVKEQNSDLVNQPDFISPSCASTRSSSNSTPQLSKQNSPTAPVPTYAFLIPSANSPMPPSNSSAPTHPNLIT